MLELRVSVTGLSSVCPKMKNWTDTQTAPCGPPLTRCTSWDRCLFPPTTSASRARRRRCVASSSRYERWAVVSRCVCSRAFKMVDKVVFTPPWSKQESSAEAEMNLLDSSMCLIMLLSCHCPSALERQTHTHRVYTMQLSF